MGNEAVYQRLFSDNESKAEAFDKLAKYYYMSNFGSMQKADLDVLMFSIYLEKILDESEDDMNTYSDYTLSKQLGITQSKVASLKERKQVKYPYSNFRWEKSFARVCSNARFDGDKIKINLKDKNLYYEVKNFIDENGGLAESTLTSTVLSMSPSDFICIVELLMTKEEKEALERTIRKIYKSNKSLVENYDKDNPIEILKKKGGLIAMDVLSEGIKAITPVVAGIGIDILKNVLENYLK